MKANKTIGLFMSVMAVSLIAVSTGYAATIPGSITAFDAVTKKDTFIVKSKSWSDPAFGDMGWTHSSDWGTFTATQGQKVTITMVADPINAVGIHPASTVWFRGDNDTAPDNYVVDHFYPQNANFAKFSATDESTNTALGNIIMTHVLHGYDLDGNSVVNKKLKGKKDKVAGKLVFNFVAPYTGTYIFVVGGVNPDATVDTTLKYTIDVSVNLK